MLQFHVLSIILFPSFSILFVANSSSRFSLASVLLVKLKSSPAKNVGGIAWNPYKIFEIEGKIKKDT